MTMELYPPVDPHFMRLRPGPEMVAAISGLYFDGHMVGTCVAIHPRIIVSAGHHFLISSDDVGALSIRHPTSRKKVSVEYAQKESVKDLLVAWLSSDVPYVNLRGIQPREGDRVATCWVNMTDPKQRDLIISPGFVSVTSRSVCQVRGTATCQGCSGAAVVDNTGDLLLGIHLASNDDNGPRVSEFIGAREIIDILAQMGVDPTAPWAGTSSTTNNENGDGAAPDAGTGASGPKKGKRGSKAIDSPGAVETATKQRASKPTGGVKNKKTSSDARKKAPPKASRSSKSLKKAPATTAKKEAPPAPKNAKKKKK